MQQCRPAQPVAVELRKMKFLRDEVVEGPDAFRMAASTAIVRAEGSDQREDALRGEGRLVGAAVVLRTLQMVLEVARRARARGDQESRRRLVGERERQLQQRSQREESA